MVCCWTTGAGCEAGCELELLCQMASPETAVIRAAAPVRMPGREVQNEPRCESCSAIVLLLNWRAPGARLSLGARLGCHGGRRFGRCILVNGHFDGHGDVPMQLDGDVKVANM